MAVPIAELFVVIGADISGALNGITSVEQRVGGLAKAFQNARPAGVALAATGAAIGAGFVGAIKTTGDFDKAMASVRANMSTGEVTQFGGAVRQLALNLGEDTAFNAQQAAAGLEELLKAGIPVEAILNGAGKAAIDLAAATGTSMADAGTIAAAALNAFGLSVDKLPGVVNTLTGVSVTTAADMQDLKQGISDVASVAAGFGLSFNDTATAIGVFRDAGLSGQTAGTALKTMLVGLQPQTEKERKLFDQLGFTVNGANNAFFDAEGRIKDLASVSGVLRNGLRGMTDAQRQATLVQLFGTQGFQAANILYEQGAEGVRRYTNAISQIDAAVVAAERQNSLAGDVEKLGGAFQKAQIIIGTLFTPALRGVVQRMTELVKGVNGMSDGSRAFVVALVAISGALALALGSFILFAPFLASLPYAFTAVGVIVGALAPVFLILAAAVAALFVAWQRNMLGIQDITESVFARLQPIVEAFGNAFLAAMGGDFEAASQLFKDALGRLVPDFDEFAQSLGRVVDPVGQVLIPLFQRAGVEADKFRERLQGLTTAPLPEAENKPLFQLPDVSNLDPLTTVQSLGLALGALRLAGTAAGPAVGAFGAAAAALGPVGLAAVAVIGLGAAFLYAYNNIQPFREAVDGFREQLGPVGNAIGTAFAPLLAFSGENAPKVIDFLRRLGEEGLAFLVAQIQSAQPFFDALGNFFGSLGNFLGALGGVGGSAVQKIFEEILIPGLNKLGQALGVLSPLIAPFQNFLAFMRDNAPTLGEALKPFTDQVNIMANGLNSLAEFLRIVQERIQALPPGLLAQLFGAFAPPGFGAIGGAADAANRQNVAFTPGGGVGGGVVFTAPIVGTVVVTGEADEDRLALKIQDTIALLIQQSVGRVEPPVPQGQPGLVAGVI